MAAKNPDKSTTTQEIGTLQAIGLCFRLPVVTAAKTAATTLIIADAAASALADNENRLKKVVKHALNEGITLVGMGVLSVHRLNIEAANALGVDLNKDLDEAIQEMDQKFLYKKEEETK